MPTKFQLDWRFEGPAALFLTPAAKGYFKDQGLDVKLQPPSNVQLLMVGGKPSGIQLPSSVELQVTETEPGVKGDTVSNVTKPATLETGAVVQVPLFLNEGDIVKIDTRTGEYLGRVAAAG